MINLKVAVVSLLLGALFANPATAAVPGTQCVVDISGFTSAGYADSGNGLNSTTQLNVGPNALIRAMGATGSLTAYGSSWGLEAHVRFEGDNPGNYYNYQPSPGTYNGTHLFSSPVSLLSTAVSTGPGGILRMQFHESFVDGNSPDTRYGAGSSITVQYTGGNPNLAGCTPVQIAGIEPDTTCASEGYTGTKLTWCKNICENGLTGATLDMWIHRWVNRYRDLPYCAVEGGEEPPPPPQEG